MTKLVNVRGYDMVSENEWAGFARRALLLNAADGGLVLLWNGYAFKSCAPGAAIGTATTSKDIGIGHQPHRAAISRESVTGPVSPVSRAR